MSPQRRWNLKHKDLQRHYNHVYYKKHRKQITHRNNKKMHRILKIYHDYKVGLLVPAKKSKN